MGSSAGDELFSEIQLVVEMFSHRLPTLMIISVQERRWDGLFLLQHVDIKDVRLLILFHFFSLFLFSIYQYFIQEGGKEGNLFTSSKRDEKEIPSHKKKQPILWQQFPVKEAATLTNQQMDRCGRTFSMSFKVTRHKIQQTPPFPPAPPPSPVQFNV